MADDFIPPQLDCDCDYHGKFTNCIHDMQRLEQDTRLAPLTELRDELQGSAGFGPYRRGWDDALAWVRQSVHDKIAALERGGEPGEAEVSGTKPKGGPNTKADTPGLPSGGEDREP